METLTISKFRTGMAATLNRVDAGQRVLLRRKNRLYAIVPVAETDELEPNEETKQAIAEAKAHLEAYKKGKAAGDYVDLSSVEAMLKSCGV